MTFRPLYVGMGACRCGRVDVRLYEIPTEERLPVLVCGKCLVARGFHVPRPYTAEDISDKLLFGTPKKKGPK